MVRGLFLRCNGIVPQPPRPNNVGQIVVVHELGGDASSASEDVVDEVVPVHLLPLDISWSSKALGSSHRIAIPSSVTKCARLVTLEKRFDQDERNNLNNLWRTCFYTSSIPFDVAWSNTFIDAVGAT